ncbi:MAG: hypothetical protein ABI352_02695 [Candidatus Dormibacter sp.]
MFQILLVACCLLGCPLLMGGMMWWLGRDTETGRLEREVRRLNAAADLRRAARDTSLLQQNKTAVAPPDLVRLQSALNGDEWPTVAAGRGQDRAAEVTSGDVA